MSEKIQVKLSADISSLSENDKKALEKLKEISSVVNDIYAKQVPANGKPSFYPEDLTKEEFEEYLNTHPDQKERLESNFTVVKRNGDSLEAVPYSTAYKDAIQKISQLLQEAAELCEDGSLKNFLISRAKGFESNDFVESEYLWINLNSSPIELTIGPYEEYEDELWAVKRSFEMVLGIPVKAENEKLTKYISWAADFDAELSKRYGYTANSSKRTMLIIDEVLAAGHTLHSFIPQAYNLPNDTSIKQATGSKQVFIRNVMEAKFENMTKRISNRVVSEEFANAFNSQDHLRSIIGHELAHGFGVYCKDGLREFGHMLEEAKADVFGILLLYWLSNKGLIAKKDAENAALAKIVDGLRQMRLGQKEAHAVGAVIQYRWLMETGGVWIENDKLKFDLDKIRAGQEALSDAFADLAVSKDYLKAKAFVEKWSQPINELTPLLAQLTDIPTDITPLFEE